ncbi:Mitochondrial import receptor subunit TOM20-2 [Raphanus sativus]|uniref:Mitochondrial import receptor subunit TOM20-2 n=1 Tax=Raphanus sativus TaxID=3726 RepID=A0A6J0KNN0_RAPSA|nr:mitochondrial import receptor subunit TOM20-2 [Raphanus sativus]KAJ4879826.1 Mitochondrial import receptor subunit TOM20-2 [Raphanus sativus]
MEFTTADMEKVFLFDHLRKGCEAQYAKDPLDSDNLLKWAGSLIELAQFQTVPQAKVMLSDAISKLEDVLTLNPGKHEALWCLGNAYTTQAFLYPDADVAKGHFDKAVEYLQRAVDEDPGNEIYRKALDVAIRGPEMLMELTQSGMMQQALAGGGGGRSASSNASGGKKKKNNDFTYDVCGWIILACGIVAWVGMAKALDPPPPPAR